MTAVQSPTIAEPTDLGQLSEENVHWNRTFWAKYDWPQEGDEWSAVMGGTRALWHGIIWPRVHWFLPAGNVLEIAPGHGRCTQFLLPHSKHLTIVDLVPECIAACKTRFGNDPKLAYAVNDGSTLPMVADESIDFAFTWDSLVHAERGAIESYVKELARVLKPGAKAFFHHSNLGEYWGQLGTKGLKNDLHCRALTMSAKVMRDACESNGLVCFTQELSAWGTGSLNSDCISIIGRADQPVETRIYDNKEWGREVHYNRVLAEQYEPRT